MAWVRRQFTYRGNSAVSLNERERTAYHLVVFLELLEWPYPNYLNNDWSPPRGHYGRLTGLMDSSAYWGGLPGQSSPLFVAAEKNIYYPRIVVYNEDLIVGRLQAVLNSGFTKLADEIEASDVPPLAYDEDSYAEWLYYWLTRVLSPSPEEIAARTGVKGHSPTGWALATKPNAIWRWTLAAYLSDQILVTSEPGGDPDGDGDGGGGETMDNPYNNPPAGDGPGGENPLSEVPFDDAEQWYDEPKADGFRYRVTWRAELRRVSDGEVFNYEDVDVYETSEKPNSVDIIFNDFPGQGAGGGTLRVAYKSIVYPTLPALEESTFFGGTIGEANFISSSASIKPLNY